MILTAGAGAAAQHVIVIWPLHLLVIAAAAAHLPVRAAAVATLVLCAASLAVTNHYYSDLIRYGPTMRWTDAMDKLKQQLTDLRPEKIVVADWGIIETMNLLSEGKLPIYPADVSSDAAIANMLRDTSNLYVAHPAGRAFHPEERAAIERVAKAEGYRRDYVGEIRDSKGRPAFELFRFQ
jgi:hypothetical protein